jgi:hypothetical protein
MSELSRYLALLLEAPPGYPGRVLEFAVALTDGRLTVNVLRDAVSLTKLTLTGFPLPVGYLRAAAQLDDWCERRPRLFLDGACQP